MVIWVVRVTDCANNRTLFYEKQPQAVSVIRPITHVTPSKVGRHLNQHVEVGSENCASQVSDCHSWNSQLGKGFFTWSWVKQNADGMVLGPLPAGGFAFNLEYVTVQGMWGETSLKTHLG